MITHNDLSLPTITFMTFKWMKRLNSLKKMFPTYRGRRNWSTVWLADRPTNRLTNQPTDRPIDRPTYQPQESRKKGKWIRHQVMWRSFDIFFLSTTIIFGCNCEFAAVLKACSCSCRGSLPLQMLIHTFFSHCHGWIKSPLNNLTPSPGCINKLNICKSCFYQIIIIRESVIHFLFLSAS